MEAAAAAPESVRRFFAASALPPEYVRLSLLDPLTRDLIARPCRGRSCAHLDAFCRDAHVAYHSAPTSHAAASARAKHEWKCPHCGKPASVAVLVDDDLFQEALAKRPAAQRAAQCDDPGGGFDHFFLFPDGSFSFTDPSPAPPPDPDASPGRGRAPRPVHAETLQMITTDEVRFKALVLAIETCSERELLHHTQAQKALKVLLLVCNGLRADVAPKIFGVSFRVASPITLIRRALLQFPNARNVRFNGQEERGFLEHVAWRSNLHTLRLDGCEGLTDLTALARSASLHTFGLRICDGVTDLSPLMSCANLHTVELRSCDGVTDLSPLASCASLHQLELEYLPQVTNVLLTGCARLHKLEISECRGVTSVSLAGCASLHTLDIFDSGHRLRQLTETLVLGSLQLLKLRCCGGVTDVSPLSGCASLDTLELFGSDVKDVSALAGCASLRKLNLLSLGQLERVSLADCASLTEISLSLCDRVTSVSLARCASLQEVRVWGCYVVREVSLAKCPSLHKLDLCGGELSGQTDVSGLDEIRERFGESFTIR